ncbi:MAG: hypothetical protein ACLP56_19890 [Candidatus Sulfotelmatobacter sp.]
MPGSALLVVSRGIIEAEYESADFGLDGAKRSLQDATVLSARDLCLTILQAARKSQPLTPTQNDLTALALVRNASPAAV